MGLTWCQLYQLLYFAACSCHIQHLLLTSTATAFCQISSIYVELCLIILLHNYVDLCQRHVEFGQISLNWMKWWTVKCWIMSNDVEWCQISLNCLTCSKMLQAKCCLNCHSQIRSAFPQAFKAPDKRLIFWWLLNDMNLSNTYLNASTGTFTLRGRCFFYRQVYMKRTH